MSEETETEFDELFEEVPEQPVQEAPTEPKPAEEIVKEQPKVEQPKPEEKPKESIELPKEEKKEEKSTFDLSEEKEHLGETMLYYGEKGDGKTVMALSHEGTICCIGFDNKSLKIHKDYYNSDPRIHVFDGIRYLDKSSGEAWLESASKTINYINDLLFKKISQLKPDWIVIDNMEVFVRTCEMAMRCHNNFRPFQPFSFDYWKERNMLVDQVHNACMRIAKKGVIYTAYIAEGVLSIKDGKVVEMKKQPKWSADIKYQTDTVIFVDSERTKNELRFFATIESSKNKKFRTGDRRDVTNKGIKAFFEKPLEIPAPPQPPSPTVAKPEPPKLPEISEEKEVLEEELF